MTVGIPKGTRVRFKKGDMFIAKNQHRQVDLKEPPIQLIIGHPRYHEYTKGVPRWECSVVWLTDGKYNFYRHTFFFFDAELQSDNIILLGETPETVEPKTHWEQIFTTNSSNYATFPVSYTVSSTTNYTTKWSWTVKK